MTLSPGQSVTIPTGWWHAAYNHVATVSVNNLEVTSWDLPEVLYWGFTFQLDWLNLPNEEIGGERHRRLAWAKGSFNIGPHLTSVLAYASREVFPGEGFIFSKTIDRWAALPEKTLTPLQAAPLYEDIALVQRQGAWLAVLLKALSAYSRVAAATPSTLRDNPGEKRHIQGWSKRFVQTLANWVLQRMKPVDRKSVV